MFVVSSGLAAPKMCAAPRADAGHGGTVGQCHWQRYKILSSKTALPVQQNTKKAAPEVNEYLAQPVKCYFIVTPRWGSVLLPHVGWTGNYQPLVCVRV